MRALEPKKFLAGMPVVNAVLVKDLITDRIFPALQPGETLILRRENIHIEVRSNIHGKLSGSGELFLSNTRLVFHCINKPSPKDFLSYEISLREIINESFEQPIFGANYLKGDTNSQFSGGATDSWRIKFYSGGCGTLLPVLGNLIQDVRSRPQSYPTVVQGHVVINPGQMVGYIDPSDPSVIYVQQPQARPTGLE